jgi:hypothetical protein
VCFSFEAWFDIEHIGDGLAADEQKKDVLSMLHQVRGRLVALLHSTTFFIHKTWQFHIRDSAL